MTATSLLVARGSTGLSWRWVRQLVTFAAVGAANTGLCLALYVLLRAPFAPPVANVVATVLTTLAGTVANGRLTFGVAGEIGTRAHVKGLLTTVFCLAITTAAVSTFGEGGLATELLVLVTATAVAGCVRFLLYRHWVFGDR